jgi:hypothetical protein
MILVWRALERGQEGGAIQAGPLCLLTAADVGMWREMDFETTVGHPDKTSHEDEQQLVMACDAA